MSMILFIVFMIEFTILLKNSQSSTNAIPPLFLLHAKKDAGSAGSRDHSEFPMLA